MAAIIAVSSISATVFADFPYEADELFMSEDIQDGDYVQITAGDEGVYEPSSGYDEVIGMTDDEVRNLYDEFLADRPEVVSEDQEMSQEVLEEFAQYAVERGAMAARLREISKLKKTSRNRPSNGHGSGRSFV